MGHLRTRTVKARTHEGINPTPRSGKATPRQERLAQPALTKNQMDKPDLERAICTECGKHVTLRKNGTISGHQARRGISCVGGNPTRG